MMNEYFVLLVDVCVAASYWCGYSLSVDEHGALKTLLFLPVVF